MTDGVIVSVSLPDNGEEDGGVLVVGRYNENRTAVDIVNAIQGADARALYEMLIDKEVCK